MRGSLDEPPIVVRTSRAKAGLRLGVLALLLLAMSPVAHAHWRSNPLAWILIGLFGALALTSVWELLAPGRLIIGPDGMEQRHLWRRRHWSWRQARRFQPARNRFYRFVGFDRPPGSGRDAGDLNQDWELPPPALASLLNAARARWSGGGS